jgi:hypothetical protein
VRWQATRDTAFLKAESKRQNEESKPKAASALCFAAALQKSRSAWWPVSRMNASTL